MRYKWVIWKKIKRYHEFKNRWIHYPSWRFTMYFNIVKILRKGGPKNPGYEHISNLIDQYQYVT